MTNNFAMPSHLTGQMSELWNMLREKAGENPEAPVKVTAADQLNGSEVLQLVEALSAVGGCTVENVADGKEVKLQFAPEDVVEETPEITAVSKTHKFAK